MTLIACAFVALFTVSLCRADDLPDGILKKEFLYDHASFPSCHASTICQTPGGLVVAFFGGKREGASDVGIWLCRQVNEQWSAPQEVARGADEKGNQVACWNPVLFQPPGGPLMLFYKVSAKITTWRGLLITSTDNGKSWSAPAELPAGILGPIKDKPLLIDGTLLCPSSTEENGWQVHMEMTPDFGKTWTHIDPLNDGTTIAAIQPTLLLHAPDNLQMLCRTKQGAVYQAWSADVGKTWTPLSRTTLPNPNSGIDAVKLRDGRSIVVYNDSRTRRTPLNIAISVNDGKTWTMGPVLENEPGEYSYPAVIQTDDGMIHMTYTWRREKIRHVVIDLARMGHS